MLTNEAVEYRNKLAAELEKDDTFPDYANMLYGFNNIRLMESANPRVGMVAGSTLWINEGMTMQEAAFIARHEILHIKFGHHFRMGDREPKLWNIACDLEISNFYCAEDDALMLTSDRLRGGLNINFPEFAAYRGLRAELVYDKLLQEREKQKQAAQGGGESQDAQGGQSGSAPGEGNGGDGSGGGTEQGDGGEGNEPQEILDEWNDLDQKIAKNLAKKLKKAMFHEPTPEEKEGKKPPKRVGTGKRKESNNCPDFQQLAEEQEKAQEPPKAEDVEPDPTDAEPGEPAKAEDFDTGGNGVGTDHAERNNPKPEPTRVKLLRSLKGVFGHQKYYELKRTYSKPNRRRLTPPGMMTTPMKAHSRNGIIVKGRARKNREWLTLGVYCDVSGSMSEEKVSLALGACKEIEKLKRCSVKVHYFDTRVKDEFFSGGGTDYNVVLAHAKENGYKSIAIITDNSSDQIPKGVYEFENMWIIGVEHSYDDSKEAYSIGPQIVDGTVKVKHFDGFIVCTEDEMRTN